MFIIFKRLTIVNRKPVDLGYGRNKQKLNKDANIFITYTHSILYICLTYHYFLQLYRLLANNI